MPPTAQSLACARLHLLYLQAAGWAPCNYCYAYSGAIDRVYCDACLSTGKAANGDDISEDLVGGDAAVFRISMFDM